MMYSSKARRRKTHAKVSHARGRRRHEGERNAVVFLHWYKPFLDLSHRHARPPIPFRIRMTAVPSVLDDTTLRLRASIFTIGVGAGAKKSTTLYITHGSRVGPVATLPPIRRCETPVPSDVPPCLFLRFSLSCVGFLCSLLSPPLPLPHALRGRRNLDVLGPGFLGPPGCHGGHGSHPATLRPLSAPAQRLPR